MRTKPYIIVAGTDYSPAAQGALRAAYEQAVKHAPAELHVVHVSLASGVEAATPAPQYGGLGGVPVLSLDEQKDALMQYLDTFVPTLTGFPESMVRVFAHVALDAPIFGVTSLAAELEADLIVVGSHGRHGIAHWLLGSVADGVVRQATCPVLVVPPAGPRSPEVEPACPHCLSARDASGGTELWCEQHRERHGRRHTYYQSDRAAAETNLPLVTR
jgi:nucleotide-binding universal stress UspA family protein